MERRGYCAFGRLGTNGNIGIKGSQDLHIEVLSFVRRERIASLGRGCRSCDQTTQHCWQTLTRQLLAFVAQKDPVAS